MYYPALTLKVNERKRDFLNTVLTQTITLLLQRKLIKKQNKTKLDFCELRSTKMRDEQVWIPGEFLNSQILLMNFETL